MLSERRPGFKPPLLTFVEKAASKKVDLNTEAQARIDLEIADALHCTPSTAHLPEYGLNNLRVELYPTQEDDESPNGPLVVHIYDERSDDKLILRKRLERQEAKAIFGRKTFLKKLSYYYNGPSALVIV